LTIALQLFACYGFTAPLGIINGAHELQKQRGRPALVSNLDLEFDEEATRNTFAAAAGAAGAGQPFDQGPGHDPAHALAQNPPPLAPLGDPLGDPFEAGFGLGGAATDPGGGLHGGFPPLGFPPMEGGAALADSPLPGHFLGGGPGGGLVMPDGLMANGFMADAPPAPPGPEAFPEVQRAQLQQQLQQQQQQQQVQVQRQQQQHAAAAAANAVRPLRPECIRVVPLREVKEKESPEDAVVNKGFVTNIRSAGPYLHMHAGKMMVVHLDDSILDSPNEFEALMEDIGLVKMLGVRLVLVMSLEHTVKKRLEALRAIGGAAASGAAEGDFGSDDATSGRPWGGAGEPTDGLVLRMVQEASGFVRSEVERRMSRSLRAPTMNANVGVNVIGGNLFYTCQPMGVRNGVDFGHAGEVRRVDGASMARRLAQGDVILLTPLGYASSGEALSVQSESLAAETAAALGARKLLYVTDGHSFISDDTGDLVQCMRLSDARNLLDHHAKHLIEVHAEAPKAEAPKAEAPKAEAAGALEAVPVSSSAELPGVVGPGDEATRKLVSLVRFSVSALVRGVVRAHIVPPASGDLLRELYTSDGAGTLISRDLYDGIRPAVEADIPGILGIIDPLVKQGIIVHRSERDIAGKLEQTYVFVRDANVVACGMLLPYGLRHAEVSCLAVDPKYRGAKRGDAMLTYLERVAVGLGLMEVFLLSTRTIGFFAERGFREVSPSWLPPERHYDAVRKSRVFSKTLSGTRELDAEELYWDQGGAEDQEDEDEDDEEGGERWRPLTRPRGRNGHGVGRRKGDR